MNVHERIRMTLEHETPDRVPTLAQYFEKPFIKKANMSLPILKRIKKRLSPHQQLETAKCMGFDSVWMHYSRFKIPHRDRPEIPEELKKKYGIDNVDNWGHVKRKGSDGMSWYMDGALKTAEILREWTSFINSWEPAGNKHFKYFKRVWDRYIEKDVLPIPTGGSVSYITWSAIGINRFAYLVRKNLSLVKDFARALGDITMRYHNCLFEQGVDMVFICDDWALKDRMIFSPAQWNDIIGPVYKMLASNAHKHNAKFLIHTDGNISECLPHLVDAGVDAIEPLEYESGARLKPLKEQFGDKITLIGNVPATFVLTYGTVKETIEMTKQCIDDAAEGAGYILGAGSDILGTCKLANVKAMIKTANSYGIYKK